MKQWNVYNKNCWYNYWYILLENREAGKIKKMYIFGNAQKNERQGDAV